MAYEQKASRCDPLSRLILAMLNLSKSRTEININSIIKKGYFQGIQAK